MTFLTTITPRLPAPGIGSDWPRWPAGEALETGILWGLPVALQTGVNSAIAASDFTAKVKVGWDHTHIQPVGITVAQAKGGTRPPALPSAVT